MKCSGHCRRTLDASHFQANQRKCKQCMNELRKFQRLAKDQGQEKWWADLLSKEPKEAEKTQRSYSKCSRSSQSKAKFSIVEHRRRITHKHGLRESRRSKWMWCDEYLEKMKQKYGGYSEMEARSMWQALLASDKKRKG